MNAAAPSWLADFLPKLRCPVTHEPLRLATAEECGRLGSGNIDECALVNQSGTHCYPVINGIPHLLPAGKAEG